MASRTKASKNQIEQIVNFMESNPKLNKGVISNEFTVKEKNEKWQELTNLLNSEGHCVKSVDRWQRCWTDQKAEVKKRYLKRKKYVEGTGGGPAPKETTDIDMRILKLIGADAYEGLVVKESVPPVLSSTLILDEKSPNATQLLESIMDFQDTPVLETELNSPSQREETPQPKKPRRLLKRSRSRGMVIPAEKTESLISAHTETHQALKEIAKELKTRNEIELRKTIAIEKYVEFMLNKK